jgi:hypothetical protein
MNSRGRLLPALILLSFAAFFGSMVLSASFIRTGKPFEVGDVLISFLISPSDNPHGYRIATGGMAVCGVLLLPVAWMFYRRLLTRNRAIARVGSVLFALGPLCAISILFFASEINDTHADLAFAAYIFMTAGLMVCLALAGFPVVRAGGLRGAAMLAVVLAFAVVLTFLIYLLFTPDYFDGKSLLRNVAFDEWALCALDAAGISGLAVMLRRPTR